jgi:hypothetical protein
MMDQGAEAGSTNVSGMDSCSIGTGDRDRGEKLDGLKKICEVIGDGE